MLFINVICHEIINDNNDINDSGNDNGDVINNVIESTFLTYKSGDLGYPYNFVINLKTAKDMIVLLNKTFANHTLMFIGFPIDCFYKVRVRLKASC